MGQVQSKPVSDDWRVTVDELNKNLRRPHPIYSLFIDRCCLSKQRTPTALPPGNSAAALSPLLAHCPPVAAALAFVFVITTKLVSSLPVASPVLFLVVGTRRLQAFTDVSKKSIRGLFGLF